MFYFLLGIMATAYALCIGMIIINDYRVANYNRILKKIHQAMWDIAKQESIPIFIKKKEEMYSPDSGKLCAGWFNCPLKDGKYTEYGFRYINIMDKYKDDSWVLAHELGHYFAIKMNDDFSEDGADQCGKQLVTKALSFIEYLAMKPYLKIYFDRSPFNG